MSSKALVLGASGATGRLLVRQLLDHGVRVIAVARRPGALPTEIQQHPAFEQVVASVSEMSESDLATCLAECEVVLSCLGHNLTFKGMFGPPRRLVTDAIATICRVVESSSKSDKTRLVLMSSAGVCNRDLPEHAPQSQRTVITLLRWLLPPQRDNEQAAEALRSTVGQSHDRIEWVVVRPDSLVDEDEVTPYQIVPSPTRNVIFNSGRTSRINVANLMARFATDSELWHRWKGQMPVIYNLP